MANYKYELNKLERDKTIASQVVETYKENIISKLPSINDIIETKVVKKNRKTFIERLFSIF